MIIFVRAALVLHFVLATTAANATVTEKSATGFSVAISTTVPGKPADAYAAFVNVGSWWSSDHSYSGDAKNFTMDVRPGGCWCETLADGGFVRHADVIYASPGKKLVFSGARGPLQTMGVIGTMSVMFSESGESTTVTLGYSVGGHDPDNFEKWASASDGVLTEALTRYTNFVSKGTP
jgi:uncharacterized protein YndB with AHSA1/START domain